MSDDVDVGGKGFLSSALLVAAVCAILLTGLILKSEPTAVAARSGTTPARPVGALALGSPIAPEAGAAGQAPAAEARPDAKPAIPAQSADPVERTPSPVKAASAKPPPPLDPVLLRLATRAEADCGRIAKAPGRWTAQLVVACKPETVNRLLAAGGSSTKLYVLPARVKEDACFRVCFGTYATLKDAAGASDLPKALRGKEKIGAVEIAKVLP